MHAHPTPEISSLTDRSMTHSVLNLQKSRFNKLLHELLQGVNMSLNRSDLAANLCLFSYLVNRTLDFEILSRATPFTSLTVQHEWMRLMPPIDELLQMINQFLHNKPAFERANYEWLWKTNSRLLSKLLGTTNHAMLPLVNGGVEDMSSRRLTGICHSFSSYFQNVKMCLHIHNLMSADESDILLKPDTLEIAEGLVELILRMIFLHKQVGRNNIRPVQSPQNHTPAHSVQSHPSRFGEMVRGGAFGLSTPIAITPTHINQENTSQQQPDQRNMNYQHNKSQQGFMHSAFIKTEVPREGDRSPNRHNVSPPNSSDRRVPSIFAESKTVYTADTATATSDPQIHADDLSQRISLAQRFGVFQVNRAFQP